MMTWYVVILILYVAGLLFAGTKYRAKIKNFEDYFLAGRTLNAASIAFTLSASWIGAASLLVSTDESFSQGISAIWIIGVPAVATLILFIFLADKIRALGPATLPSLVEERYGRAARLITSVLIVWYMAALAASQLVALGSFLKTFTGLNYLAVIVAGAALVFVYSGFGGFLSVVRTHILQFCLLMLGVAALVISVVKQSSWQEVKIIAKSSGMEDYFYLFNQFDRKWLIALSFILAWTVSPIAWQRIQAARDAGMARKGLITAALFLGIFYLGIVVSGMLMLPVSKENPALTPIILGYLSHTNLQWLTALVFISVVAAILSTTDAAVNSGAYNLASDLVEYRLVKSEKVKHTVFPLFSTVAILFIAVVVASRFSSILKTLGLASKIMAEGLFVPGIAALLTKKRRPLAGVMSLLSGGSFAVLGFCQESGWIALGFPEWPYSIIPGAGISLLGFTIGMLIIKLSGGKKSIDFFLKIGRK